MNKSNENFSGRDTRMYRGQVVTIEDLDELRSNLLNDLKKFIKESAGQLEKKWLKSYEVKKMLGISPGTLQNLRVNGTLPFTKIGGVILYDYEDVQSMLNKNKHDQSKKIP